MKLWLQSDFFCVFIILQGAGLTQQQLGSLSALGSLQSSLLLLLYNSAASTNAKAAKIAARKKVSEAYDSKKTERKEEKKKHLFDIAHGGLYVCLFTSCLLHWRGEVLVLIFSNEIK